MAIEPKTTREHIISLYGHMTGIKKEIVKNKQDLKHIHEDVEKLGRAQWMDENWPGGIPDQDWEYQ